MYFLQKRLIRLRKILLNELIHNSAVSKEANLETTLISLRKELEGKLPGAPVLYGRKAYSNGEDDGIITEIFRRIKPDNKLFIEIGCGDGLENNTHFLLLCGWKGLWLDGDSNNTNRLISAVGADCFKNLLIKNAFVTLNNTNSLIEEATNYFGQKEIDFFSIDIDGNDRHIVERVLQAGWFPKVFCVEYNAKLFPPCAQEVAYNEQHTWAQDDYMGVSLQSWVNLLSSYQYTLITCDISGVNAYFVRKEFTHLFPSYSMEQLYMPPRYYLNEKRAGHRSSLKFLKQILEHPDR